jgi:prefoldin subunit 5
MEAIQKDFNALDLRNTEIDELKAQLSNLEGLQERYAHLEAEVKELRSQSSLIERLQQELRHLRDGPTHPVVPRRMTTPPLPSTPRARSPRMQLALCVVLAPFLLPFD